MDFKVKNMNETITFFVLDQDDQQKSIEVPTGISLNLMEVLKAPDYPIEATCGGMALCATCHIHVVEGLEQLPEPMDDELDMLDTLPVVAAESRLACQLKIGAPIDGIKIKFPHTDEVTS